VKRIDRPLQLPKGSVEHIYRLRTNIILYIFRTIAKHIREHTILNHITF